jgi:hypothetical protein
MKAARFRYFSRLPCLTAYSRLHQLGASDLNPPPNGLTDFGHYSKLLDGLPKNVLYFSGIHRDDCLFSSIPAVSLPDWGGVGRKPTWLKTDVKPVSASRIIDDADMPWTQVVAGTGAKGPVVVEYKSLRVIEAREGLPKS